jgi:SPOR domain
MRQLAILVIAATIAVAAAERAHAQDLQRQLPKTQLEAFTGEIGVVIIKGYTEIGSVSGTGKASVMAMTFRNAKSGQQQSGIVVEVNAAGSYTSTGRSLIDYEEIAELLNGISYVSKAQKSETKLRNFEATYSTKGDLMFTVFNDASGKKNAVIKVGSIGSQKAYVSLENLAQFAQLIVKAKDILDRPESAAEASSPQSVTAPAASTPNPTSKPKKLPVAKTDEYYVQVSSQSSEAEALAAYKSLQSKYPNVLANRQPLIHRADLGPQGTFFRAMVGPFTNSQEAGALCSNMRAAGGMCLVQER